MEHFNQNINISKKLSSSKIAHVTCSYIEWLMWETFFYQNMVAVTKSPRHEKLVHVS